MATTTRTTEEIVLVGREGHRNNVFDYQGIQRLISSCDAPKDPYTVVSIIGLQSGGKSTLMNGIFNTKFTVMDESIERGRTTKGIWASICNDARAIVLDVEGTDSVDNQNDLGFETRTALFSLVISDVIFVNMWLQQVNLAHGNALLKKIFEEVEKQAGPEGLPERYQTKIVFTVRNYNGKTPERKLKETIISNVNEIWRTIPQKENSKLENYFKLHVELFPDLEHEELKFDNKCKQLRECIIHGDWVDRNVTRLPVSAFPSFAKELWDKILGNKTLDLPSQMEMMARTTCDSIMLDKFQHFRSTEYVELTRHQYDDPKQFDDNLGQMLDDTISEYNNETHLYGKYAEEKKIDLKTKILHHAEEEFKIVMKRFRNSIIEKAKTEIRLKHGERISEMRNRAISVVAKYFSEFQSKTKDLKFYTNQIDHENFRQTLDFLGKTLTDNVERMSTATCSSVFSAKYENFQDEIYKNFQDNKEYQPDNPEVCNPREFENRLKKILEDILDEYDTCTEDCAKDIAEKMKNKLKKMALKHAEQQFIIVMKAFQETILANIEKEIKSACGKHTSGLEKRTESVVSIYRHKFLSKTEGLDYYNKLVDSGSFIDKLEWRGEKMAHDIKKKNIKELILRVARGVLTGVATAASTLAVASPLAGPWAAIVGLISSVVAAITGGAAATTAAALAQHEKDDSGAVAEEGENNEQEYLSKIMEAASAAADQSQFQADINGNAVAEGHKIGSNILRDILGTEASGDTSEAIALLLDQSMKGSRGAAVEAGDKLGGKILATIMGAEASGFDFETKEGIDRYVGVILKGISEDPSDKAP